MRPRTITTVKLLAVALTAFTTTSCARRERVPETSLESAPEAPRSAEVVPSSAATPTVELGALADELASTDRAAARAELLHFRPLCDAEGYPLVGNIVRKGPMNTQPSELCEIVRSERR